MSNRRIRSLKPGIVEDEKTGPLSDAAFRLFMCMIVLCDDLGACRADVRWLRNQIWWAHENPPNVLLALVELARSGLVEAYAVRGATYVRLRGWAKHQRIDNAGKMFAYPKPDDEGCLSLTHRDLESLGAGRDLESLAKSDLESPTSQADRPPPKTRAETRGDSPRTSETLGSDQEKEEDKDQEGDREVARPRAKAKRPRKTDGFLLPDGWQPLERERGVAIDLGVDLDDEVIAFRNHHKAKGTLYVDWDAAFNGWIRRSKKFADNNARGRQLNTPFDEQMQRVRRLEAEERTRIRNIPDLD